MNILLDDLRIRARRLLRTAGFWGSSRLRSGLVIFVLFAVVSLPAYGDFIGALHRGVNPRLETDVWESSDGVLVLHRDLDMCRTTNIGTRPGYAWVVPANNPLGRFPWIRDSRRVEGLGRRFLVLARICRRGHADSRGGHDPG